jgi:anaphase-promoting complex subunit 3
LANEASRKAVKLNPFLWQSFADLCNRGDKPDPNAIFQMTSTDIFQTSQHNNLNSMVVVGSNTGPASGNGGVIISNEYPLDILGGHLSTPVDQVSHNMLQNMTNTPNNNYTSSVQPNNNSVNLNNTMPSLRGGSYNMIIDETPKSMQKNRNDSPMIND